MMEQPLVAILCPYGVGHVVFSEGQKEGESVETEVCCCNVLASRRPFGQTRV